MKDNNRSYKIVGHRGWPERYPENSCVGLLAAASAGADGLELDVQVSLDGECVVIHDSTLGRTSEVSGDVFSYDLHQLCEISIHEPQRFANAHNPTQLASLHHVSEVLADYSGEVFVELKDESIEFLGRERFLEKALQATEAIATSRIIIAFDWEILRIAKTQYKMKTGWVIRAYDQLTEARARALAPDVMITNYRLLPKSNALVWQGDWKWFAYDVTDKVLAESLADRGVDYIETWDVDALST